jgi:hypothetical protein
MTPPSPRPIAAKPASQPERWQVDAGAADVARLDIPGHAERERRFEVSCSFFVAHAGGGEAWHELRLLVNGVHEWSRRVPTHEGRQDSLDFRFQRVVPVGEPLRLTATTAVKGARRISLQLSAEEE